MEKDAEKEIRSFQKLSSNKKCFNCQKEGLFPNICFPSSTTSSSQKDLYFAIFVCERCASIHRKLQHRVVGIAITTFSAKDVKTIKEIGGNRKARKLLLAKIPKDSNLLPTSNSDNDVIEQFMRRVFQKKEFFSLPTADNEEKSQIEGEGTKKKKLKKLKTLSSEKEDSAEKSGAAPPDNANNVKDIFGAFDAISISPNNNSNTTKAEETHLSPTHDIDILDSIFNSSNTNNTSTNDSNKDTFFFTDSNFSNNNNIEASFPKPAPNSFLPDNTASNEKFNNSSDNSLFINELKKCIQLYGIDKNLSLSQIKSIVNDVISSFTPESANSTPMNVAPKISHSTNSDIKPNDYFADLVVDVNTNPGASSTNPFESFSHTSKSDVTKTHVDNPFATNMFDSNITPQNITPQFEIDSSNPFI